MDPWGTISKAPRSLSRLLRAAGGEGAACARSPEPTASVHLSVRLSVRLLPGVCPQVGPSTH